MTASNNTSPPLAGTLTQRLLRLWPYFRSAKTGIALAAVSTLMADLGIDWKTASLNEIRVAYIRLLREQAAGRWA